MEKWPTPLMGVEYDWMRSKAGDITIAFSVKPPELFTLADKDYDACHQAWIEASRLLPKHCIFRKQVGMVTLQLNASELPTFHHLDCKLPK